MGDASAIDRLLGTYPRTRPPLPEAYQKIYQREYTLNRGGGTFANRLALRAERWMHDIVAERGVPGSVLELGAGTLNHVPFESRASVYDAVEPLEWFYTASPHRERVRQVFRQIQDVPREARYDRVISIAVLEHLEDLPSVIAETALRLAPGGMAQHAIPSEGGAAWGAAWRMTTGLAYRLRNSLSYGVAMRHEHINDAREIVEILRWFFERVELWRHPLPFLHGSFYTYIEAFSPQVERCRRQLAAGAHVAHR